jgi:hypothetical protein
MRSPSGAFGVGNRMWLMAKKKGGARGEGRAATRARAAPARAGVLESIRYKARRNRVEHRVAKCGVGAKRAAVICSATPKSIDGAWPERACDGGKARAGAGD